MRLFSRQTLARRLLKLLGAFLVLLALAAAVGVAMVYFSGTAKPEPKVTPGASYNPPRQHTPRMPAPNAPEGVSVQSISTPAAIGSMANVQIKTNPTSVCKAEADYRRSPI